MSVLDEYYDELAFKRREARKRKAIGMVIFNDFPALVKKFAWNL